VLAHLAEKGAQVTLACATKGEAGRPHPSVGEVADLGELRAEELRLSCERLGINPPCFLGFHDSARKERQRHDDPRALANVDMLEVEAAIRRVIDDVKPHVIVTFDPHGGYYHPDHVAVHRATTAAFFSTAVIFDARPCMDRKSAALAAHTSAFGLTLEMLGDPPPEQARRLHAFAPIMEHELFTLGATRAPVPRWPLRNFFDGLDVEGLRLAT
jgi:N-acetyl-1-D-myo-inositol-2-amino-2-deoxy-alpha-D-glucopyranoside deacetylase